MEKVSGVLSYDRFKVPYRKYGSANKIIVCLSGAKQTMSAWRSFISYFHHEYSVVVFDMPGQGRAQILSGPAGVSLDEQVEVLNQVVLQVLGDAVVEKLKTLVISLENRLDTKAAKRQQLVKGTFDV
jgi:alpha-beta hydrolase superfamily lysophospholipase